MKFPFYALTIFLFCGCPSNNQNTEKDLEGVDQNLTTPILDKDYPIQPVPFTNVSIDDTFWTPRIETNRNTTLPYNFKKCEETGRISNFSKAGGLEDGEFEGIFFNDSDVFKVIEGASYSLQVHNDPELKAYLDELIFKIVAAQEKDGYLYTNRTINPRKADDKAGEVRWTRLVSHHELYNVGHLYEAAVAHYQATGERSLLDVAIKNANLVARVFGPDKNMGVPGHQEIEIGLVKLYRVTGEKKYLDLAKFFIDQRGNADGHNLNDGDYSGEYQQDHLPLKQQSTAVGHAVRAGYFYAGATDVAALTDETAYDKALGLIWDDIVHKKIYLTGGIGAEPKYEGFGPAYELPNATAYTETCAAIALMLWNHRMFLRSGDVKFMDVFERTLYNGFLAGISLEGNTFFYPNPLESDGVFKFNQGVCGRSPWFDCSCCPVNIVRILPSLPGYVYAVNEDTVYMNLYMSNTANIPLAEGVLSVNQKTNYPWNGKVEVSFNNEIGINASLKLRIPGWNRNEVMDGDLYTYTDNVKPACELRINGELFEVDTQEAYLNIPKRKWSKNDKMEIIFEMPVRKVKSNDLVTANKGKMALERGPIVYCIEAADNHDKILEISIRETANYQYKYDKDILGGLGVLRGPSSLNKNAITAIPYYAWAHRDTGPMTVWMKTD